MRTAPILLYFATHLLGLDVKQEMRPAEEDLATSCILAILKKYCMDLIQQFETAVAASKTLAEKPSNEILLQLYAFYKQATEGDIHAEAPSNPFDFVAKAKYNAWKEQKGKSKETAMQAYIDLVNNLKG